MARRTVHTVGTKTIKKNGDLSHCDNWHGISLLDVNGKLFTKVIQGRLLAVVEVVPDSQCGFCSGGGCVDMTFCAQQLVEKAREHNSKIYMLFVDLRKAHHSVPCQALRLVLQKYGIQSLHDGMKAEVTADGGETPEIEVQNGLRQGCPLPLLQFGH